MNQNDRTPDAGADDVAAPAVPAPTALPASAEGPQGVQPPAAEQAHPAPAGRAGPEETGPQGPRATDGPAAVRRRLRTRHVGVAAGVALALAVGTGAWSLSAASPETVAATATEADQEPVTADVPAAGWEPRSRSVPPGAEGLDGTAPGASVLDQASATTATATQQVGLVTIVTTLGYQQSEAAGTGIVLTSDGTVLTNNHVIEGATDIEVTVESTGETFSAEVVGTDATRDVAVLRLDAASGLATVTVDAGDDDGALAVGDPVTAVGNAEGGGTLMAAAGTVTALDETITTQDSGATAGTTLVGLVEIQADVVAGDSGGAVLDADGEVVAMTTAASSGPGATSGYAIAIGDALDVAAGILAGEDTDTVTIGYPAFLGVVLTDTTGGASGTSGAAISGVLDGTPAAEAGLAAGDVVTSVDGAAVSTADALAQDLAQREPGESVELGWTSTDGASHVATVVLAQGPAD